ncbi:serine hydrolase domain-containing protein [Actinomadura montaniterrae]|uniref:Beta-lactamase family protein n=1 Tax=Actinomadura montaniterrae TaxID=1803903 RepID=A0A6L3VJB0_9ACTN|nr:serine hydrolase domain-containing protein [Actinomadura montaniterrae]KAB2366458.1 beta-lactamase family protein [Actinomadura montaniterrae]
MSSTVQGHCDPAFAAVREVFEQHFADGRELGAAVAVYAGDRKVVDLWGGVADHRTGRAWTADTPCFGFSCTKAVTAAAALLLAERGAYEVDGPVTAWWPEFGEHGKDGATAAHLLSHQVGLPAFDRPVSAEEAADPKALADLLAAQKPEWTPGEAHGYHALTYGWLAGEIVRRLSGRTVGAFAKEEFTGGLDMWIGAPDDVIGRAAKMTAKGRVSGAADGPKTAAGDVLKRIAAAYADPRSPMNRALNNPHPGKGGYNNPVVLRAGWPSAGVLATASGFAGFYRDLVAGRILRPDTLREAMRRRVSGPDRTLIVDSSFGLGFMRPSQTYFVPKRARETAFGHTGAGGSIGLGDPDAGLALAYLPNRMGEQASGDLRAFRLTEAAYASLG